MANRKKGYGWLLALTIVLTIAAIITVIPDASATKACYLGYDAYCTFTLISTLICLLAAGVVCKIRNGRFKN